MLGSALSGLATGTLLGLLGGGGSIIAVPILVYWVGLETKEAIGTSLIIVGLASLLATWSHHREHAVVFPVAIIFGLTGGLGSFAGARLAQHIPDYVQLILFAFVMACVALLMLMHRSSSPQSDSEGIKIALPVVLIAGLGAGFLTGLLGVGGGFIIVPTLTILLGMSLRKAIGTSLLVIAINSIIAAVPYAYLLNLNFSTMPFAIATLASAPFAGRLAHYIPQEKLKFGFAISLLVLSAWMLTKQIFR